jgi:hypothetical protein
MIVMPADNSSFMMGWMAATFPNRLGWLLNACCWRQDPRKEMPWAMDNGAFGAMTAKREWDEEAFYSKALIAWRPQPRWIVVPDVVGNREATIESWKRHYPRLKGRKLAFAVQDGMTARDVPDEADVVFIGGGTNWKWQTARLWCADFPRVHIGRVNGEKALWMAHESGAESCDGTGWGRDPSRKDKMPALMRYIEQSTGSGRPQMELGLDSHNPNFQSGGTL